MADSTGAVDVALPATWRAAAWMGGAVLSFLMMALAGRELSATLSTFQILCFRSVVGLGVVGLLAWRARTAVWRTQRPGLHVARNLTHLGGQFGWFFAIAALPLASVFAIEFTIPLWTALLAALLLGERLTVARAAGIALGLAGVLMILRPGAGLLQPADLAAAQAARETAVAQYERSIQTAFREVADALAARQSVIQLEMAQRQNAVLLYRVLGGGSAVGG